MRIFKKVYMVIGILLIAGVIVTGKYGLSKIDKEIYNKATQLQEEMSENGFQGFMVEDKKVRFFDGTVDYVVSKDDIKKEKAAFDTFVGTTSKIDGEYQVLLPTYENFSSLFSLLDTATSVSDGSMQFSEESYNTNAHVATLWHEAFHAWQLTNWEKEIFEEKEEAGIEKSDNMEELVVKEIDSNEELVVLFSKEMELLADAYKTTDMKEKKTLILEALEASGERKSRLSEKNNYAEQYYEMLEGTACYIEAKAYYLLEREKAWRQTYLDEFVYHNGAGKYYRMGMYKCLLLDQIAPEWKDDFSVTGSLDEYLYNGIGQ